MSDLLTRLALVSGALLVVAVVMMTVIRRRLHTRPRRASETGLAEGVYLFTSATCSECAPAREKLDARLGPDGFREIRWEEDAGVFDAIGIDAVPVTMIVGDDGSGTLWPGQPVAVLEHVGP